MFIKKDFDDITVQVFEEKYRDALNQFELSERQQILFFIASNCFR